MVVFGDSHAEMWMPPMLKMAKRDQWSVVPFVKVGCVPSSWTHKSWPCGIWYRWAVNRAAALHPQATLRSAAGPATPHPAAAVKGVAR